MDENGDPLVVYHGTSADFEAFDNTKVGKHDAGLWGKGHYFSAKASGPSSYALRQGEGARIIPAYVSIQNPLVLRTGDDLVIRLPDGTDYRKLVGRNLDGSKIKRIAIQNGHDGVIQLLRDGSIGDVVAYDAKQIKGIYNRGTWSKEDANIMHNPPKEVTQIAEHIQKLHEQGDWSFAAKEQLPELLRALDKHLTGKTNAPSKYAEDAENLMDTLSLEFYLSDGGYSRVWIDADEQRIFVTDNSRNEVKQRWEDSNVMHNPPASYTLYHGTSHEAARDIIENGIDMDKSTGGYFGTGFYLTHDKDLAKSNYADFAEDEDADDKTGVVLKFKLSPSAKILDLDDPKDFEEWKRSKLTEQLWKPDFHRIALRRGIQGVQDLGSFGGLVVYDPSVLKLINKQENPIRRAKDKESIRDYSIIECRTKIGRIAGYEDELGSRVRADLGIPRNGAMLNIRKVFLKEKYRGQGKIQEALEEIASQYEQGIVLEKFQASPMLQKAFRKVPGVVETNQNFWIPPR